MTVIVIFLVFAGIVGVLWIGATDVREGVMTPGELVQFVIYAVLVAGSTGSLSEIVGELQRAAGATERLVELLQTEDSVSDPAAPVPVPAPVRGEIALRNLAFRYPTRPDAPALDGVDLTIRPGETVALVGPSGAGKSTVLHLLLRFYDPQAGAITLDVNGERRQVGDIADMIWSVTEIIAELGRYFTLQPGDLIFTGTPAGVGPVQRGDRLHAEIAGVGTLAVDVI